MKIFELFQGYRLLEVKGDMNREIKDLCYNSSFCKKDFIFFAIKGENVDGHRFIEEAIKNGAVSIICENFPKNLKENITYIKVNDSRDALSFASNNFFGKISDKINLIGVTGTNGKTTITYLLEKLLTNTAVIGTINYRFKDKIYNAVNTTPNGYEINRLIKEFYEKGAKNVVIEVSSHSVVHKRVNYLNFNCGIFTNLSHEHLDFHENMENYFNAKKNFFVDILLKSKKENKFAVINIDDNYGKRLYEEIKESIKVTTYSLKNKNSDVYPEKYKISLKGIDAEINTPKGKIQIKSNLIGEFNLLNLLAVICVGLNFGLETKEIEKSLNREITIPGRMEKPLKSKNYFIDYAHTPDALENVLITLNKIKGKRRIITVFGCGGDRDKEKRPIMGYIAGKLSDFVIVTSDNPRNEDPFKIIDDILKGLKKAISEGLISENNFRVIPDRSDAIKLGIKACKNSDILLIAGKGHEDYQIIGTRKIKFSDKEEILKNV